MIAFSPCKINVGLDIVSKRPDGYHDIVTAMVPVPWHDIIEIIETSDNDASLVTLGNKVDCPPESNLVMKAYRAMQTRYNLPPAKIVLEKIIPDGAGLGGGSADAATTILLLNDMYVLNLSKAEMAQIAAKIGADCPFFIYQTPMLATGTGTDLAPLDLDLSMYTLLIAKPLGVNISTRQAYAGVAPHYPETPLSQLLQLPIDQWQGRVKNDFEPSIFALAPEVEHLKSVMLSHGAVYASMSGSGASVYGLFASKSEAQRCASTLETPIIWLSH